MVGRESKAFYTWLHEWHTLKTNMEALERVILLLKNRESWKNWRSHGKTEIASTLLVGNIRRLSEQGKGSTKSLFGNRVAYWLEPCHVEGDTSDLSLFKISDTKEAGFLYALSSATLALKFSSSCLSGTISNCNCGEGPRQLSLPSDVVDDRNLSHVDARLGCKGIMRVGREFSSKFITMGLRRQPKSEEYAQQVAVRQHNTQVGLKVLHLT